MGLAPASDMPPSAPLWDVIIVGAGPAGLSAALVLGRCRRRVLICDAGRPRNRASKTMYAFLTRDGISPRAFHGLARKELARYPNVALWNCEVEDARRTGKRFQVRVTGGRAAFARKLLLATGLRDELPDVPGMSTLFGRSVFTCPYCDAWEVRDQPLAVYGRGRRAFEIARAMNVWTSDLVVCTDGPAGISARERSLLEQKRIPLHESRIERLKGRNGILQEIVFEDGQRLARRALFFDMPSYQQSDLARRLGCSFTPAGGVHCGKYEATDVAGVYVAGNTIKDVHLAIVAAAEGAKAALGINKALTRENFGT